MKDSFNRLTRRDVIKGAAQAGLTGAFMPLDALTFSVPANGKLIEEENKKTGTTDWQLTFIRSRDHRSEMIEGYCSRTSVRAGEEIDIFLSANPATDVTIDFYRMGYYGGKGGRHVKKVGPLAIEPQPTPAIGKHRLRACQWKRAMHFKVPDDWVSGVYQGKLSCGSHRYESYIVFVVRDDRKADIMFQTSDTTWQAYNKWPDDYSLYDSDTPQQPHSARTWVSYDRPYGKYPQVVDQPLSQGSGEFLLWEYPLCFWLEEHGYDVTYCSNIDTHADRAGLKRVKCFLSVGHDEYWTLDMYNNVKQAIGQGLNAAFLSGNSVKWMIDLQKGVEKKTIDTRTGLAQNGQRIVERFDEKGDDFRTMYRRGRFGGLSDAEKAKRTYAGPFPMEGPNEGLLMGARNPSPPNGSGDWVVRRPAHWIFEGTGMAEDDKIPGLVGWEHHGDPVLSIPGLEVIASGVTISSGGLESESTATVYPGPKDNWVFNAATIFWSVGLAKPPGFVTPYSHFGRPHGADERVQKITGNFFKKCGVAPRKARRSSGMR
jgi:hypothetical protein